jgi:hypothetical protein
MPGHRQPSYGSKAIKASAFGRCAAAPGSVLPTLNSRPKFADLSIFGIPSW